MRDDEHLNPDEHEPQPPSSAQSSNTPGSSAEPPESELPASVIFMEMMRQAAAKAAQAQSAQISARASNLPAPTAQPPVKPSLQPQPSTPSPSTEPFLEDDPPPSLPHKSGHESPRTRSDRESRRERLRQTRVERDAERAAMRREAEAQDESDLISLPLPDLASTESDHQTSESETRPSPGKTPNDETSSDEITIDQVASTAAENLAPSVPVRPESEPLPDHPLTGEERRQAAAMEAQRVHRVKRRQEKRRAHRVSILGGIFRSFLVIIPSALLMATILSWWTNPQFLQPGVRAGLQAAIIASGITPSPTIFVPTPNWLSRIGIVSGHNGPRPDGSPVDPGATCENASGETYLTEREVNFDVATRVVVGLRSLGYSVDLMDEFDPRLANYQGAALVSIHSNTCRDFGEVVSGYLVAKAEARPENGVDTLLADCITRYYGAHTRMPQHFGVTEDMTDYHSFREIHPSTPAAIIELGFLRADQEMLTKHQDELAAGIVDGIRCFIDPQFDLQNAPPTGTVLPGAPDGTPGDATLTGDTAAETLEGTPPQP